MVIDLWVSHKNYAIGTLLFSGYAKYPLELPPFAIYGTGIRYLWCVSLKHTPILKKFSIHVLKVYKQILVF